MTFTRKILAGLFLGILLGLFLGELAAPLDLAGQVFIGLLQMTVLPYIILSLVVNLGRISWRESRGLLLTLVAVFACFLVLGAAVLFLTPWTFPAIESASFFKASLIATPHQLDLVGLYVPSNPFASMAANSVPAVVLFSIFLGIGLSSVPGAAALLDALDALAQGLNKVNKLVILLTPYGVFAIAASTAGTLSLEELSRLQGFIITYTLLVLVMALLVIPLFVSALTPFRFRELLGVPKNSLITIFATGKIIVLLPQLMDDVTALFKRHQLDSEKQQDETQVILPLAYPFPNLGTYLILMFVGFAAWYIGRPLDISDQLMLQGMSLFSSFISPLVGVPFLLDIMRLPADVMELFIVSTVYTDRIRVLLGAMHLFALTVIVLAIRHGVFKPRWRAVGISTVVSLLAVFTVIFGTRAYLVQATDGEYRGYEDLMHIPIHQQVARSQHFRDKLPALDPASIHGRLAAIEARGSLRVAYLPDSLPWAFVNTSGEVTGFDIELAHQLATDLNVSLEIVRISFEQINELLATGQIDIVMSGLAQTPERLRQFKFAGSTLDLTLGFLVADHERKQFSTLQTVQAIADLHVGVVQQDDAFVSQLHTALPAAKISTIQSPRRFLRGDRPDLDAVLYSAEGGSAWTLIYPDFSMVVPQPANALLPAGFIVPRADAGWAEYIEQWVDLRRKDGTVNRLFDHWIKGQGARDVQPRWSIIRNVLGWVD